MRNRDMIVEAAAVVMAAAVGWIVGTPRAQGSVVDRSSAPVETRDPRLEGPAELCSEPPAEPPQASPTDTAAAGDAMPSLSCLAATLCALKERVRWRTSAWTMPYCERIADAVLKAAQREHLPPALIVAVMINESSLDPYALRLTMKGNTVYAKDGGLMGLRCIVDHEGRCLNGQLRGMPWSEVIKPATNIALGAAALAYWRDTGGVVAVKSEGRGPAGGTATRLRYRRCPHTDHAYWAHYNHGERYIDHGRARHYPHRIAVLYYALARAMSLDTKALTSMRLSVNDAGRRPRTADQPIEPREVALCHSISSIGPVCSELMTARNESKPAAPGKSASISYSPN